MIEGKLSPADVGRLCGVSHFTARDWITVGVKLPDGCRVRLKGTRVGGRWFVAPADVGAFTARCTRGAIPADDGSEVAGHPVPSKSDRRRLEATIARLKAQGIG